MGFPVEYPRVYMYINSLQEKAVEATKQKEEKREKPGLC
jgi:hypothetical protein